MKTYLHCLVACLLVALVSACSSAPPPKDSDEPLTEEGVVPERDESAKLSPANVDCAAEPPAGFDPTLQTAPLEADSPLLDPGNATEQAPETFWVKFETTQGPFVAKFDREWAPRGVDRVYNLIEMGYFERIAFFRVIEGFMAQFGIHGNPKVSSAWEDATIAADPVNASNTRGMISFAQSADPDSRTVQLFINFGDNSRLDSMSFSPIGQVTKCMENVDALYSGYGEGQPRGSGPSQKLIQERGNQYLGDKFPRLDYIIDTTILAAPDDQSSDKAGGESQ